MATGCPCGAHVKPGYDDAFELTGSFIDILFTGVATLAKYRWAIIPWIGSLVAAKTICALPRVEMPVFEFDDFVNIWRAQQKFNQLLAAKGYELFCECDDCPPITGCNQGEYSAVITPEMGYLSDDEGSLRYHIPTGAELWVERSDGQCLGLKNGIWIYWMLSAAYPEPVIESVNVRDGSDGAPGDSWDDSLGTSVTIYFSNTQVPSQEPIQPAPEGVQDYEGPLPCTTSDLCVTLDEMTQRVRRMEFMLTTIAGPDFGLTAPWELLLPGVKTPIVGTIVDALPRVLSALAPIQPSQLDNPETTPVATSSIIELLDVAYVTIELTVVPDRFGYYGTGALLTYNVGSRATPPGRYVVIGQEGIIADGVLRHGEGTEFAVPSTATDLAIHLEPGVTIEVTTWERTV